jgi:hypothetical protein
MGCARHRGCSANSKGDGPAAPVALAESGGTGRARIQQPRRGRRPQGRFGPPAAASRRPERGLTSSRRGDVRLRERVEEGAGRKVPDRLSSIQDGRCRGSRANARQSRECAAEDAGGDRRAGCAAAACSRGSSPPRAPPAPDHAEKKRRSRRDRLARQVARPRAVAGERGLSSESSSRGRLPAPRARLDVGGMRRAGARARGGRRRSEERISVGPAPFGRVVGVPMWIPNSLRSSGMPKAPGQVRPLINRFIIKRNLRPHSHFAGRRFG